MANIEQKLLSLRQRIDKAKADRTEKQAELKHAMKVLQEEHNLSSVKDAEKELKKLQKSAEELEQNIQDKTEELEQKYFV